MVSPLISRPEPLGPDHDVEAFRNGRHPGLDDWLRHRARASEGLSARTYVTCRDGGDGRVVGYYALATAAAHRVALPSAKLRRAMPEDVPLILLARLAINFEFQGRGLGRALLADALWRCLNASEVAGIRAVIAHAIDDEAASFYLRHGFILASDLGERAMLLPVERLRAAVSPA